MDFSNLWKHCYTFTHAFFHKVQNYVQFRYRQDDCVQQSHAVKRLLLLFKVNLWRFVACYCYARSKDQR